jgi:hypothetical protein
VPAPAYPANESLLAVCSAPTLPGFVPYTLRPGDRLADLLTGLTTVTVTQLAALNCIDDPTDLPIGATIWIPGGVADQGTLEATAETTAETTQAAAMDARIISLTTSEATVESEAGMTISWQAEGSAAFFYRCPPDPQAECRRPLNATRLPLVDTVTLRGFQYAGPARFRLEVLGSGDSAQNDVSVTIVCSNTWLSPANAGLRCPSEPARRVFGAWQPFEHGAMLWFSDTGQIWVLYQGSNQVSVFQDAYTEGQPEPTADVPGGLFLPNRGFGLVWWRLRGTRSGIGWGVRDAQGADLLRQPVSDHSFTTYILAPNNTVYAVTILPGQQTGYWTQLRTHR